MIPMRVDTGTHLLGEATEELVEKLGEDEADVLQEKKQ